MSRIELDSRSPAGHEQSRAAVQLRNVTKLFSSSSGIADVNLSVNAGEFLCIVGPSGCGKTTVLDLIAGLQEPDAGEVVVAPAPATGQAIHSGYMLARDSLYPWRTARANVELAMVLNPQERSRSAERRQRADVLLDSVGLRSAHALYPRALSQGMRQRVALARTLALNPAVFLMDEPFGALDAQTRRVLQEEFLRVWAERHATVLFVTHDLVEAMLLADRVVVFNGRPGTVTADYKIEIPREQRLASGPFGSALGGLYETLWNDLHEGRSLLPPVRPADAEAPSLDAEAISLEADERLAKPRRRRDLWDRARIFSYRVLTLVALLGLWQLFATQHIVNPAFVSRPTLVVQRFYQMLQDGSLTQNTLVTLQEATVGWLIGSALGVVLGYLAAAWRTVDRTVAPFVDALNSAPRLALVPLFVIWFGLGQQSKVALVISVVVVIAYVATNSAAKSVDSDLIRLAKALGAGRISMARRVVVPWCVPYVFSALRISMSLALTAAVVGEMIVAQQGLGTLLARESGVFDTTGVMTIVVVIMLIAYGISLVLYRVERRLLRWRPDTN